jgi:gluconokinase
VSVLILESSTSAAKAMLYGRGVTAIESEPYTPEIDKNGRQDTERVYLSTLRAGRKAARGNDVEAIAVSGVWHSIAVCDASMKPAAPTYTWAFTGAADICRKARTDAGFVSDIYRRTGCVPNVTYSPYALKYLSQNGLDLSDKLLSSQAGYNFFRMTGERLESRNIVSGMGLLNLSSGKYDEAALDYAEIRSDQLCPLADYKTSRPLSKETADYLGLPAGIPVVPPHSDGALNQMGNSACRPGIMTFSVGTSAALRLFSKIPLFSEPAATWCYAGIEDFLSGAATAGACNCVNWFKDVFLKGKMSFEELESDLLNDAATPVYLPFLFGERCPGWEDSRMGGFYDIRPEFTATDMFRAIAEGVLFNIYQCYEILEKLDGPPDKIILSGGILNSEKWTQMAADILGREFAVSRNSQASLLGGASLALYACGALDSPWDFGLETSKFVSPRLRARDRYLEKYARYRYWYEKND